MRIMASTLFLGVSLLAFMQGALAAGDGERKRTTRKRAVIIPDAPKRLLPDLPNFGKPKAKVVVVKKDLPHISFFGDVSRTPVFEILGNLNTYDRISTQTESNSKAWNIEALITLINGSAGKGGIRNMGGKNEKGAATADEISVMMSTILDFCENNRKLIPNAGNVISTILASLFNHSSPAVSHIYKKEISDIFEKKDISEREARHRLGIYALIRSCVFAHDKLYGKEKKRFESFDAFVKTIINETMFDIGTLTTRQAKGFNAVDLSFIDSKYLDGARKGLQRLLEANSNAPGKTNPFEQFYNGSLAITQIKEKGEDSNITQEDIDTFFNAPENLRFITEKMTHSNEEPLLRELLKENAKKTLEQDASFFPFTIDEGWNAFSRKDFGRALIELNTKIGTALGHVKEERKIGDERTALLGAFEKTDGTLQEKAIKILKDSKLWVFFNPNREGAFEDQERLEREEKEKEQELHNKNLTLQKAQGNNRDLPHYLNQLNELQREILGYKKIAENDDTGIDESNAQARLAISTLENGFRVFDNVLNVIEENGTLRDVKKDNILILKNLSTESKARVENEKAVLNEILQSKIEDDISPQIKILLERIANTLQLMKQDDVDDLSEAFNESIKSAKNVLEILENLLEEEQVIKKAAKDKVNIVKRIILDMPEFNSPDDIPENHVSKGKNKLLEVRSTLEGGTLAADSVKNLTVEVPCFVLNADNTITISGRCPVQFVMDDIAKNIRRGLRDDQALTIEPLIDVSNVFLITDDSNNRVSYYLLGRAATAIKQEKLVLNRKKASLDGAAVRIAAAKNDKTGIIK